MWSINPTNSGKSYIFIENELSRLEVPFGHPKVEQKPLKKKNNKQINCLSLKKLKCGLFIYLFKLKALRLFKFGKSFKFDIYMSG